MEKRARFHGFRRRALPLPLPLPLVLMLMLMLMPGVLITAGRTCGQSLPALDPIAPLNSNWFSIETVRLPADGGVPRAYEVFRSPDLATWERIATAHHLPLRFADPGSPALPGAFYRMATRARGEKDNWNNVVALAGRYPGDRYLGHPPFFTYPDPNRLGWSKFTIDLARPHEVVYQNSNAIPLHYDFATKHFDACRGLSRQAFDRISLFPGPEQKLLLGAVVLGSPGEIGVQFVGAEPYAVGDIADWIALVATTVNSATPVRVFYVPTYEQAALSPEAIAYLAGRGITVASADRWRPGNAAYSEGWAMGRLRQFAADEVAAAFAGGRLLPTDILLIDAVPAELPPVAGILSLAPATPSSHVAILARSYGIPFVYLRDANDRALAESLVDQEIYCAAATGFFFNSSSDTQVKLVAAGDMPGQLREELLALKELPKLQHPPKESPGGISRSVDGLSPGDSNHFGGKAAHYGYLRSLTPEFTPEAVAFSFDLWDAFMDNPAPGGAGEATLGQAIASRLSGFAWPVADMPALTARLLEIQELIKDAAFTAGQRAAILEALGGFEPLRKVRFRSSTNVEDGAVFSGAGLYDSYSGCIADDTDGDENGPSACDPGEENERGVFRAIRKVYASFYNQNAFLERLRYGVDEASVGMAILSHYSYPDDNELANGVATVEVAFGDYLEVRMVTQLGAVSVANPEGGAEPEVVTAFGNTPDLRAASLEQYSSLVTLGASVMEWDVDYLELGSALISVYRDYARRPDAPDPLVLDFEFKKMAPGSLVIKQVRPIPPPRSERGAPFLLNGPARLAVAEGEGHSGFFGRHRLKSRWTIATKYLRITPEALGQPFLTHVTREWMEGSGLKLLSSPLGELANFRHRVDGNQHIHSWSETLEGEAVTVTLTVTNIPESRDLLASPVVTLEDLGIQYGVTYPQGHPEFVYEPGGERLGTTRTDSVTLEPDRTSRILSPRSTLQVRQLASADGAVAAEARFYWPPEPTGPTAGYTAPADQWVQTRITGILAEPIILTGYYAQTYVPGHHNFTERFLFAPERDSSLPEHVIDALRQSNIRYLIGFTGDASMPGLQFFGWDGTLRTSPQ